MERARCLKCGYEWTIRVKKPRYCPMCMCKKWSTYINRSAPLEVAPITNSPVVEISTTEVRPLKPSTTTGDIIQQVEPSGTKKFRLPKYES